VEDKPPKFRTANDDEKRWMHEWVFSRLDDEAGLYEWRGTHLDELFWESLANSYDQIRFNLSEPAAVEAAEQGDIEPLRGMFPQHARFINLPKLRRGRTWKKKKPKYPFPPRDRRDRLELAVAEERSVRAIWKEHYGRTNQSLKDGQLTPGEIVAERWGLNPEEVIEKLKRLPNTKNKKRSMTAKT
jgi:hypothetical protein